MYGQTKESEEDFWEALLRPFAPFSWSLWGLIFGVLVLSGVASAFLEQGVRQAFHHPQAFAEALYFSFIGFFSGGIATDYGKLSSRILALGLAFFITVSTAAFTGSTTSFLIQTAESHTAVASLEEALHKNKKVCFYGALGPPLISTYPKLKQLGVEVEWGHDFKMVREHKCLVAIISKRTAEMHRSRCGFEPIGPPVMTLPGGFFVSQDLGAHFAFHNAKLQQEGVWNKIASDTVAQRAVCEGEEKTDIDADHLSLEPSHMAGNCVILVVAIVFACIVQACVEVEHEIVEHIDKDHDHHVTAKELSKELARLVDSTAQILGAVRTSESDPQDKSSEEMQNTKDASSEVPKERSCEELQNLQNAEVLAAAIHCDHDSKTSDGAVSARVLDQSVAQEIVEKLSKQEKTMEEMRIQQEQALEEIQAKQKEGNQVMELMQVKQKEIFHAVQKHEAANLEAMNNIHEKIAVSTSASSSSDSQLRSNVKNLNDLKVSNQEKGANLLVLPREPKDPDTSGAPNELEQLKGLRLEVQELKAMFLLRNVQTGPPVAPPAVARARPSVRLDRRDEGMSCCMGRPEVKLQDR